MRRSTRSAPAQNEPMVVERIINALVLHQRTSVCHSKYCLTRRNVPLIVLHDAQTFAKFLVSEFSTFECITDGLQVHEVVSLILHSLLVVY